MLKKELSFSQDSLNLSASKLAANVSKGKCFLYLEYWETYWPFCCMNFVQARKNETQSRKLGERGRVTETRAEGLERAVEWGI